MKDEEEQLQHLLNEFPVFEPDEKQKLRCTLTGHEIPSRLDQLSAYTKTSKFVRAFRIHQIMEEYGEYFDDIGPNEFGCKVTMKIVAKDPDDLLRHINGKKFKRGLEKAALNEESESSDASEEEEMEQDEVDMGIGLMNDDSFSGEDDEDGEYPELTRNDGEAMVESDSHDFAVMDTEKDMTSANRKRKADSSTARKKKRTR